jgi:pimeloyl-ACP methyl ester carboxylesterase
MHGMLLPVEGHHLHTVDLGQGTPLVLHSGWVASWGLWLPLVERLQTRWRCVAYDHRGTGASTFPPEAISAEALVDDLFRVLDALAVEQAVLAGESLGCMVCLKAVLRDPSRFLGLITVGGFPRVPAQRGEAAVADPVDWPIRIAKFVDACLPEPDAEPMHRLAEGTLLPSGPEAAARMSAALAGTSPELEAVAVPTLVIHGALDALAPVAGAHELANTIPGAQLVVIDDAGHVPPLTRPDAVASAINSWWTQTARDAQ